MLVLTSTQNTPIYINPYEVVSIIKWLGNTQTTVQTTGIGQNGPLVHIVTEEPEEAARLWTEAMRSLR